MIQALRALERFLLPNACVACDGAVAGADPDAVVCGICRSRLRRVVGGCPRCQAPMPPVGPCRFCAEWPPELTWARSAVWLTDEAREIVHHFKYQGLRALGTLAAGYIARTVGRPAGALLVPVPLDRRRARVRGFNQAQVIADALAAAWRLPVGASVLWRARAAVSQTALAPQERLQNVAAAFRARPAPPPRGEGAESPIILVDDVVTTGATARAAASALGSQGWRRIGVVSFARALPFALRATAEQPSFIHSTRAYRTTR